ncbi:DUF2169 family type VI secretion system accessory protein [Chondromyces crocatus]|uniref:DUF2169 domain-containing protein n=1 Tax=Chondromyces crocatus TaxID=52 RepID=A0A0K1EIZ1_CHOCO|nr:DUF2169 domain-containing protein [Chondromyces crocatus]AKT40632.1 uncharacterized protein CMC5_047880 [Chondromyces crocatus]
MEVVSASPLRVASVVWQPMRGVYILTVVCKATYALQPDESVLADVQDDPNESDDYWNDDEQRSLSAASDLVPFKQDGDVYLVGHAHAPKDHAGGPLLVRLVVGEAIDKSIEVHGERAWSSEGRLLAEPRFSRVALRWERAAGGPGTSNPVGMPQHAPPDARNLRPLPNLQPPGLRLLGPVDRIPPVGFGPIAPIWPERMARLRKNAGVWDHRHWNASPLPVDIDKAFFNAAPPDQRVEQLQGDERIVLEGLHPYFPKLTTRLSPVTPRAMVERGATTPKEVQLRCDTLVIDTDRGVCTLAWRGWVPLSSPEEAGRVMVTCEMGLSQRKVEPRRDESVDGATKVLRPGESLDVTLAAPLPFVKSQPAAPSAPAGSGPAQAAVPPLTSFQKLMMTSQGLGPSTAPRQGGTAQGVGVPSGPSQTPPPQPTVGQTVGQAMAAQGYKTQQGTARGFGAPGGPVPGGPAPGPAASGQVTPGQAATTPGQGAPGQATSGFAATPGFGAGAASAPAPRESGFGAGGPGDTISAPLVALDLIDDETTGTLQLTPEEMQKRATLPFVKAGSQRSASSTPGATVPEPPAPQPAPPAMLARLPPPPPLDVRTEPPPPLTAPPAPPPMMGPRAAPPLPPPVVAAQTAPPPPPPVAATPPAVSAGQTAPPPPPPAVAAQTVSAGQTAPPPPPVVTAPPAVSAPQMAPPPPLPTATTAPGRSASTGSIEAPRPALASAPPLATGTGATVPRPGAAGTRGPEVRPSPRDPRRTVPPPAPTAAPRATASPPGAAGAVGALGPTQAPAALSKAAAPTSVSGGAKGSAPPLPGISTSEVPPSLSLGALAVSPGAVAPPAGGGPPEPPMIGPLAGQLRDVNSEPAPGDVVAAAAPEGEVALDDYPIERFATITAEIVEAKVPRAEVLQAHALTERSWKTVEQHWQEALRAAAERGDDGLQTDSDRAYVAAVEGFRGPIRGDEYTQIVLSLAQGQINPTLDALAIQRPALMPLLRQWTKRVASDRTAASQAAAALATMPAPKRR